MPEPWFFEVLPFRPAPYPDECLSSYLPRLAEANQVDDLWSLLSDLFPAWQATYQIGMLHWEYPLERWGRLPARTYLTPEDLSRLTVLAWVAKFRTPPDIVSPNYNGPRNFLYHVIAPHAQVCPLCLQAAPYVRLLWRLTSVHVCLEHECRLQTHCRHCGALLRVIGDDHRHLRCAACDADWRDLPVRSAPDKLLEQQRRCQANVRFLLDPATTLVRPVSSAKPTDSVTLRVGMKFRYLRTQAGLSVTEIAQRSGINGGVLSALELGRPLPLHPYLQYLEVLGWSWPEFAALDVAPAVLETLTSRPHMRLRQCPNPECPNHLPPPTTRVQILRDLPERRVVRFHCVTCGQRFTLSYDGQRLTKRKEIPFQSSDSALFMKPKRDIQRAVKWGLAGKPCNWIARQLGWQVQTVRRYWGRLGIAAAVHRAQAARRAEARQQRCNKLQARIEALLPSLLEQDRELNLRIVARALGYGQEYLQCFPDQAGYVQDVITPHNARVRQQRDEVIATRVHALCAALPDSQELVTLKAFLEQLGLAWKCLHDRYPDLAAQVQQALQEHERHFKAKQLATRLALIDAAVGRMVERGMRLTHKAILREAGLSEHLVNTPAILQHLQRWAGSFPWVH